MTEHDLYLVIAAFLAGVVFGVSFMGWSFTNAMKGRRP